jgi:hypothetical protein
VIIYVVAFFTSMFSRGFVLTADMAIYKVALLRCMYHSRSCMLLNYLANDKVIDLALLGCMCLD